MRAAIVACLVIASSTAAAAECRLRGAPWLEGRVAASAEAKPARTTRAVDARRGDVVEVFVVANGTLDGRRTVFSDDRRRGHTAWRACDARVEWRRVEPRPQHMATPAPNASVPVYANAVVLGPEHGELDRLRLPRVLRDRAAGRRHPSCARRAAATGAALPSSAPRAEPWAGLGVMHLAATVHLGDASAADRRRRGRARRHAVGARLPLQLSQRRRLRRLADLVLQRALPVRLRRQGRPRASRALRRGRLRRRAGGGAAPHGLQARLHERRRPRRRPAPRDRPGAPRRPLRARLRRLRRPAALVGPHRRARRGPRPRRQARRQAGPRDLVMDTGDADGLKLAPLADQGEVRISVLRPR